MLRPPLSNERLSALVNEIAASAVAEQRARLAGTRLQVFRLPKKRASTLADDEAAKIRAELGGDIVGRLVPFVISTPERAEDDHTIDPMGWDTADYERAPHVFWQHEYSSYRAMPSRAAARIGASTITKTKDALVATCGFFTRDFSQTLDGGFSYAIGEIAARQGHRASVGFDVVEANVAPEEVRKTAPWALDITVARLNEWSLVNFGADSQAITEGRAAGIDVEPIARALERFLDDVSGITGVARAQLATMWAAAADPGRPKTVIMPPPSPSPSLDTESLRAAIREGLSSALA
jgi:hypothetical protein